MQERRVVKIVSSNIDFPSTVITIMRSIATTIVLFIVIFAAGAMVGESAYKRLTGVKEIDISIEVPLFVIAVITFCILMVSIFAITKSCYGDEG